MAEAIAEQLIKRAAFKRTMKQYCETVMNAGAKGVKIICSGRLAGAEMARKEMVKMGSIPLHTLKADVDYATATAITTYGCIGIKVWIYKGNFGEEQLSRSRPAGEAGPARRSVISDLGGPAASCWRNTAEYSHEHPRMLSRNKFLGEYEKVF